MMFRLDLLTSRLHKKFQGKSAILDFRRIGSPQLFSCSSALHNEQEGILSCMHHQVGDSSSVFLQSSYYTPFIRWYSWWWQKRCWGRLESFHFSVRYLQKSYWAGAQAYTSFRLHFHNSNQYFKNSPLRRFVW